MLKITKLEPSGIDDRGTVYDFSLRESKYFIVLNRKKGSVSGRHYHKGASKSKNPEILYLFKGKIKLITKNPDKEIEVDENSLIEIPVGLYHEVHALTDIIIAEICVDKDDFEKHDTVVK